MAIVPRLPKIPKIKLPKLPKLNLALPVLAIAGLTVAARAKLICALITAAFSPLQKIFQQISDISGTVDSIKAKVSGALQSAKNLIKSQVSGLVNQAVAPVAAAVKALSNLPGSIVASFNSAKESLSKQSASVKSIIEGELNCISDNLNITNKVGEANSAIKKTVEQEAQKLSNKEKKEILENPTVRDSFVDKVTDKALVNTSATVSAGLANSNASQVKAVEKLQTLQVQSGYDIRYELFVSALKVSSRQELLRLLKERMSGFMTIYTNAQFPDVLTARLKEIARIEEDIKNFPNTPKRMYIEDSAFIIQKNTGVTKLI